jgi:hypothetical protein
VQTGDKFEWAPSVLDANSLADRQHPALPYRKRTGRAVAESLGGAVIAGTRGTHKKVPPGKRSRW